MNRLKLIAVAIPAVTYHLLFIVFSFSKIQCSPSPVETTSVGVLNKLRRIFPADGEVYRYNSLILPGRSVMTTVRSLTYNASSISWVTKSIVICQACQIRRISSCIEILVKASSAPSGSSSSITFGGLPEPAPSGPLSHASGELMGKSAGEILKTDKLDKLVHLLFALFQHAPGF